MGNEQFTVNVPDVGEGVAEVEIVTWAVAVGDPVARLQTVAEVMTDKATVEVPSPVDGVVAELGGRVGEVLLVGSPLIKLTIGAGSADVAESPTSTPHPPGVMPRPHATGAPMAAVDTAPRPTPQPTPPSAPPRRPPSGPPSRPLATPAVRRRAREAGVDLRTVAATGPAGRVTHDDLDGFLSSGSNGTAPPEPGVAPAPVETPRPRTGVSEAPMIGLRRKIAEQMLASTSTIPHITYVEEVDVTHLEDLRATLNKQAADNLPVDGESRTRLTLLPFLVRALTNVLVEYPQVNAHLLDADTDAEAEPDVIRTFEGVHIGIATQTANGLVVPVLRHAESHTIWSSAAAIAELTEATRSGSASPADLSGSTISITSLGPLGGIVTTPVINKPEVAIVGVNKIVVRPVWVDGEFVPRKIMNLSSSFDHRVIDGWDAANFIQAIKAQLEQPALLFVDDYPGHADYQKDAR